MHQEIIIQIITIHNKTLPANKCNSNGDNSQTISTYMAYKQVFEFIFTH